MLTYLSYAADILMIAASSGAAIYCLILSRRLSRLTSFDKGIGGAIAVLSTQVDEMKAALGEAKAGTEGAGTHLQDLVRQARDISRELELMIAACHDFAEEALVVQGGGAPVSGPEKAEVGATDAVDPPPVDPDPAPVDSSAPATPVFGTRRVSPDEPVFRHHAQA
jgi:hypothetical protein